jgi:ribonuclease HI
VWKKASDDSIAVHGIMDIEMFTDGSVVNKLGAGAADIYKKRLIGGNKVYRVVAPAGALCSSYKSEIVGVQCGLNKLISTEAIIKEDKSIIICTDSQSLVAALAKGPITQTIKQCSDIWTSCLSLIDTYKVSNIVFQLIKSHVVVLKNERVDESCGRALMKYSKEKLGFS